MLTMITQAWIGSVRHCRRMHNKPVVSIAASSVVNNPMTWGAKIARNKPSTAAPPAPVTEENQNASRTRSKRFAPQLKPATGW